MMKHLTLNFDGTTASVKRPILPADPVRIVSMRVVCSTGQSGAATVSVGQSGAATPVLSADLDGAAAMTTVQGVAPEGLTAAERGMVFGADRPMELDINLAAAGKISIVFDLDPFLIEQM